MRYIDADALSADWLENGENEYVYDTNTFLDSIDNAPTADVAPVVHGRWEMFNGGYGWKCSACENISFNTHCYCPNCSARMDGED